MRLSLFTTIYFFSLQNGRAQAKLDPSEYKWLNQTYVTSPLQPPYMNITKHGKSEPGYFFLTPTDRLVGKHARPTILDSDGELIWQGMSNNATGLKPQLYQGKPVLTYWEGERPSKGAWAGSVIVMNGSYDEIARVTVPRSEGLWMAGTPDYKWSFIDMHEATITTQGTMLVIAPNSTRADLRPVGGHADNWVLDDIIHEVDIASNEILFRWSAWEHLPLTETYHPFEPGMRFEPGTGLDWVHLNSADRYSDGYIISSREHCSIIAIDHSGAVQWTLDGQTGGDFVLGLGTQFCWQHDARVYRQTDDVLTLSLLNNANVDYEFGVHATTGLLLDVHLRDMRVTLNRRVFDAADQIYSTQEGNLQKLGNGHLLVAYGVIPRIKEFDVNGACVMTAQYAAYHGSNSLMDSYRVFRAPWVGTPRTIPSVSACMAEETIRVYVSWNGATDIRRWEIFLGMSRRDMAHVHTAVRNGFETVIEVEQIDMGAGLVRARAVGGPNDGVESDIVSVRGNCLT